MIIGVITGNENECAYSHSNPSHQNRAKGTGCKDFRTMARQVSWESRLHEIRRSVSNSVRSHYDRRDLELLFKLQPRAANKLLETVPTVRIGRSDHVEKEALKLFLDGAHAAEDVAGYCAAQRAQNEIQSRRKPRTLVRRDFDPVPAASLSRWLTPGMLKVPYSSLEELADILWRVASAMRDDLEEFAQLYEAEVPVKVESDAEREVVSMFEELDMMEQSFMAAHRAKSTSKTDTKRTPCKKRSDSPLFTRGENAVSESPLRHQIDVAK